MFISLVIIISDCKVGPQSCPSSERYYPPFLSHHCVIDSLFICSSHPHCPLPISMSDVPPLPYVLLGSLSYTGGVLLNDNSIFDVEWHYLLLLLSVAYVLHVRSILWFRRLGLLTYHFGAVFFFMAGKCRDMGHLLLLFCLGNVSSSILGFFWLVHCLRWVSTWALVPRFLGCKDVLFA